MKQTSTGASAAQISRVNKAFDRLSMAIDAYLKTCQKNNAPVLRVSVNTSPNGSHGTTLVRYRGSNFFPPD